MLPISGKPEIGGRPDDKLRRTVQSPPDRMQGTTAPYPNLDGYWMLRTADKFTQSAQA
jgi:hypothetical protein